MTEIWTRPLPGIVLRQERSPLAALEVPMKQDPMLAGCPDLEFLPRTLSAKDFAYHQWDQTVLQICQLP